MWRVVRESVKKTLDKNLGTHLKFNSREELINSAVSIGKGKFKFNPMEIIGKSKLLENLKTQVNLAKWF